jgi:MFS family permease
MRQHSVASALPGKPYLIFTIVLLMLISTLRMADYELLAPLFAPISKELGVNDLQFGMIRSVADVVTIVGIILFGLLADRMRRCDLLTLGILGWSVAALVTGYTRTFFQLFLANTFMRFFQATYSPTVYPMLSDLVPRRSRGIVLGLMGTTFALGTVLGLALPVALGTDHWRTSFIFFGAPGLVLGLLALVFLREPVRGSAEDELLDGGEYSGSFSWRMLAQTIRTRTVVLVWLLDACEGATWFAFSFWTPAYLLRVKIAHNADSAALALLPAIGGFVVGNILGGWLTDRLRRRTELSAVYVALISMSGALVMTMVVFALRDLTAVMVAGFVMGTFGHMVMSPISVILYDVVPPETRSSATAFDGLVMNVFCALSSLAIGAVSQYAGMLRGLSEGDLRTGFQGTVTVLLAAGVVVTLLLFRFAPRDMETLRKHVASRAGSAST